MAYVVVALVFLVLGAVGAMFALANNETVYVKIRRALGRQP